MNHAKYSLSPLFIETVKASLQTLGPAQEKAEQNCRYRLDFSWPGQWLRVKQFTNGTLYLESNHAQRLAAATALVDSILGEKSATPTKSNKPASPQASSSHMGLTVPYIGTDESGKGDYFGPLVIAGAFITPEQSQQLAQLGVQDSKQLSAQQIQKLAGIIRQQLGSSAIQVITILPKRYNELYESFKQSGKNLNHLLAWGHAKAIEQLLTKHPSCTHAIADQFGSEHYIQNQLQTLGKQIKLIQTPRAEANTGVAAASILARDAFVQALQKLSTEAGVNLPLGAGSTVLAAARQLVQRQGHTCLNNLAKLHFKTTQQLI